MTNKDGARYAPDAEFKPVCEPGDFCFAAAYLDHGHIYGQAKGLIAAGATLRAVYDPEPERVQDARLDRLERSAGEAGERLIELDSPTQGAEHQLGGERSVAPAREPRPLELDGRRAAALEHVHEALEARLIHHVRSARRRLDNVAIRCETLFRQRLGSQRDDTVFSHEPGRTGVFG